MTFDGEGGRILRLKIEGMEFPAQRLVRVAGNAEQFRRGIRTDGNLKSVQTETEAIAAAFQVGLFASPARKEGPFAQFRGKRVDGGFFGGR